MLNAFRNASVQKRRCSHHAPAVYNNSLATMAALSQLISLLACTVLTGISPITAICRQRFRYPD